MFCGEVIGCILIVFKVVDGFVVECLGVMEYCCYVMFEFVLWVFFDGLMVLVVLVVLVVFFNCKDFLYDDFLKGCFGFLIDWYIKYFLLLLVVLLEGVVMGVGYGLVLSS